MMISTEGVFLSIYLEGGEGLWRTPAPFPEGDECWWLVSTDGSCSSITPEQAAELLRPLRCACGRIGEYVWWPGFVPLVRLPDGSIDFDPHPPNEPAQAVCTRCLASIPTVAEVEPIDPEIWDRWMREDE